MTFSLTEAAGDGTQHGDTPVIPTGAHYLFSWDAIKTNNTTIAAGTAITTNGHDFFIIKQDIDPGSVVRNLDPADFDSATGRAYFKRARLEDAAFGVATDGTRQFTLGKEESGHFRATDLVTVLKVTENAIDTALKISETEGLVLIKKKTGNSPPAVNPFDSTTYDTVVLMDGFNGTPGIPADMIKPLFTPKDTDTWFEPTTSFQQWTLNTDNRGQISVFTGTPAQSTILAIGTNQANYDWATVTHIRIAKSAFPTSDYIDDAIHGNYTSVARPAVGDVFYLHKDVSYDPANYAKVTITGIAEGGSGDTAYWDLTITTEQTGDNWGADVSVLRMTTEVPADIALDASQIIFKETFVARFLKLPNAVKRLFDAFTAELNKSTLASYAQSFMNAISAKLEALTGEKASAVFDSVFSNALSRTFVTSITNSDGEALFTEPTGVSQDRELAIDYADADGTTRENWLAEIDVGDWVYIVRDSNVLLFKVEAANNNVTDQQRELLWTNANAYSVGSWPSDDTLTGAATIYFANRDLTEHLLRDLSNAKDLSAAGGGKIRTWLQNNINTAFAEKIRDALIKVVNVALKQSIQGRNETHDFGSFTRVLVPGADSQISVTFNYETKGQSGVLLIYETDATQLAEMADYALGDRIHYGNAQYVVNGSASNFGANQVQIPCKKHTDTAPPAVNATGNLTFIGADVHYADLGWWTFIKELWTDVTQIASLAIDDRLLVADKSDSSKVKPVQLNTLAPALRNMAHGDAVENSFNSSTYTNYNKIFNNNDILLIMYGTDNILMNNPGFCRFGDIPPTYQALDVSGFRMKRSGSNLQFARNSGSDTLYVRVVVLSSNSS